jgi:acetylornithine/succinyldiaminopimelate/putrescine aminotransferase
MVRAGSHAGAVLNSQVRTKVGLPTPKAELDHAVPGLAERIVDRGREFLSDIAPQSSVARVVNSVFTTQASMIRMGKLRELMSYNGPRRDTIGLSQEEIEVVLKRDHNLVKAIDTAYEIHQALRSEFPELLKLPEAELIKRLQEGVLNFYPPETVNPFVPLAAFGPWMVTSCGAVVHDNGGYGMMGLGHSSATTAEVLTGKHEVMANVMTASFAGRRVVDRLWKEIGHHSRDTGSSVYERFAFLNSGSESVALAARIVDHHAKLQTTKGARHHGKKIMNLSQVGSFHGRVDKPARVSDSSLDTYRKLLASFEDQDDLLTVKTNSIEGLEKIFADAEADGVFIQAFYMEPVMGEGRPGVGVTPEYYRRARELTRAHGTLLIVDSIQAGIRTHGVLSVVDYPGFENEEAPDMETYSKAANAGQLSLSILALSETASRLYVYGMYGNTMTGNPRALDMAATVLDSLTDDRRKNIRERGVEFVTKLEALREEFPDAFIEGDDAVNGTGLLFAAELNPDMYDIVGPNGIEGYMRQKGIEVVHGGKHALRFTPPFDITTEEVDLIIAHLRDALENGPRVG